MVRNLQSERFLAKVKIEIDIATRTAWLSLPDFGVPKRKNEAIVEWDVIEAHKDYLCRLMRYGYRRVNMRYRGRFLKNKKHY